LIEPWEVDMKEFFKISQGVLSLDTETFVNFRDSKDVFKRGLTILVVITLIAGSVRFVLDLIGDIMGPPPREQLKRTERDLERTFEALRAFPGIQPEVLRRIEESAKAGMRIGFGVMAIPTRLPYRVGSVFKDVGRFASRPFVRLSGWMFYTLAVLVIAKLLGGRATLQQMLGTTALYSIPHLLDILGPIPCLGALLGIIATVWGFVIYVKATAVANELSIARATFATILPALVIFALIGAMVIMGILIALIPG
jgi:hypothetical protein